MSLTPAAQAYIERRGWDADDYEHLGVYSEGDFVYFPLRDYNDQVIGAIGRNITYKTYNIKIQRASHGYFLWRGVDSDRALFLVEGVFDVGWLLGEGFHAAAYVNNTLLGAQLRVVARFYERVVIIPDNDSEGVYGSNLAAKRLKAMGVQSVREFKLNYYKDVCDVFENDAKAAQNLVTMFRKIEARTEDAPPPNFVPPE
jgi:DNA primase